MSSNETAYYKQKTIEFEAPDTLEFFTISVASRKGTRLFSYVPRLPSYVKDLDERKLADQPHWMFCGIFDYWKSDTPGFLKMDDEAQRVFDTFWNFKDAIDKQDRETPPVSKEDKERALSTIMHKLGRMGV